MGATWTSSSSSLSFIVLWALSLVSDTAGDILEIGCVAVAFIIAGIAVMILLSFL
ncbi:MAG TPA: hypothetical protein VIL34_07570 [Actinopolymorphaceae bacterium]